MPDFDQDEAILFEDDQISIWYCRFQPGASVPPHNHNMTAFIGVFHGTERNDMYEHGDEDILKPLKSTDIHAGEVLSIAPDAIHGVTCTSAEPSEAIHVYLGALSRVDRDLYDMEHGTVLAFTDENYSQLTQDKN
jgi:predicted metal-dependent enzyme (double-stranded beta helix superfamily)